MCSDESVVDDGRSFDSILNEETDVQVKEMVSVFQRLSSSLILDLNDIVSSPNDSVCASNVSSAPSCSGNEAEPISSKKSVGTQTESRKLNLFDLTHNDSQLKAFTGVTFTTLNILTKLVLEVREEKCEATMKNKVLLTLCKLRLTVSYECLSVFVGDDRRRCGEYFESTLHLLRLVLRQHILAFKGGGSLEHA